MNQDHKDYVLGFIVSRHAQAVLLIEKIKPAFQNGFLNGIGGKIELEDSGDMFKAMARECEEETGLKTTPDNWKHVCTMNCKENSTDNVSSSWTVHVLTIPMKEEIFKYQSKTEEIVHLRSLNSIVVTNKELLGNITWLVGMSIDSLCNESFVPPVIEYKTLSLPLRF